MYVRYRPWRYHSSAQTLESFRANSSSQLELASDLQQGGSWFSGLRPSTRRPSAEAKSALVMREYPAASAPACRRQ